MIYRNRRPYWESDILDIVCNSGYGNPYGHSLVCLSNLANSGKNFDGKTIYLLSDIDITSDSSYKDKNTTNSR